MKKIPATISFVLFAILAIAQNEQPPINIYPNPFVDSVTYKITVNYGDSLELKLFDLKGRHQLNLEKQPFYKSQTISLRTEQLNNGIYLTSISLDSITYNNKIIKDGGTRTAKFQLEIHVNPLITDELTLYPNPTSSELNLIIKSSANKIKISLLDLNGKKLLTEKVKNETGIVQLDLDLSNFENGVYLIHSKSKNGELTRRVIKGS